MRHFPSSPHEHVVAGWLRLAGAGAVISHASALELHGISDIIPAALHVSVPRAKRGLRPRTGVRVHTLELPLASAEIRSVAGVPVTSPERTMVDALEYGIDREHIELAIQRALDRGLTTPRRLRESARRRSAKTRSFVDAVLGRAAA